MRYMPVKAWYLTLFELIQGAVKDQTKDSSKTFQVDFL